jgi:hypothetical protein
MWNSISRRLAATCFAGLATAALLTQIGCSGDSEGSAPAAGQGTELFPASQATGQNSRQSKSDLKQPMLKAIDDALDEIPNADVKDLGTTKDEARSTLVEADEILTRIKEENRQALQRANNPPRRVPPRPTPPPEEQPAPQE